MSNMVSFKTLDVLLLFRKLSPFFFRNLNITFRNGQEPEFPNVFLCIREKHVFSPEN